MELGILESKDHKQAKDLEVAITKVSQKRIKIEGKAGWWWHTHVISALGRQR